MESKKKVTENRSVRSMAMNLYAFDLDDTLVVTDSCIRTAQGRLSTADFAKQRETVTLADDAFVEFSRIRDCRWTPAPCFGRFIQALRENAPIAIVTARGNEEVDVRAFLEEAAASASAAIHPYVHIYCCNNPEFVQRTGTCTSIEARKQFALSHFLAQYPSAQSIEFSDDDLSNLAAIRDFFTQLRHSKPALSCCLYRVDGDGSVLKEQL